MFQFDICSVDVETTGVNPQLDQIIEIGIVRLGRDGSTVSFGSTVKPTVKVPEVVLRLTGIKPDELSSSPVIEDIVADTAKLVSGCVIVGHNVHFDVGFLLKAGILSSYPKIIDTLHISKILFPMQSSYNLGNLCTSLGISLEHAHRAVHDAKATLDLLLVLKDALLRLDRRLLNHLRILAKSAPSSSLFNFLEFVGKHNTEESEIFNDEALILHTANENTLAAKERVSAEINWKKVFPLSHFLEDKQAFLDTLPNYEPRPAQIEMLEYTESLFDHGGMLYAEAGTGTGKSLAYLLPAAAFSVKNRKKTVISTYTIDLQEQLVTQDLPCVARILPFDVEVAVLKGRSNYVSVRRFMYYLHLPSSDEDELYFKARLLTWLTLTRTGDKAELRLTRKEERFWQLVASQPEDCIDGQCLRMGCFVHKARQRADQADVIIVNHALLAQDSLAGGIIPKFHYLVVDEAHHLEEAVTSSLTLELRWSDIDYELQRLLPAGQLDEAIKEVIGLSELTRLSDLCKASREYGQKLFVLLRQLASIQGLNDGVINLDSTYLEIFRRSDGYKYIQSLRNNLSYIAQALIVQASASRDGLKLELKRISDKLASACEIFEKAFLGDAQQSISWVDADHPQGQFCIYIAPLDVRDYIEQKIFSNKDAVLLTSATLAIGKSFDFIRSRVGGSSSAQEVVLPSPFRFDEQAIVVVPNDMPNPRDEQTYWAYAEDIVVDLSLVLSGHMLVLFTSKAQLDKSYVNLKKRLASSSIEVLAQGTDGNKAQITDYFIAHPECVVLGTKGLWEGVDFSKSALRCVVITKLPFHTPGDPVFEARSRQHSNPFSEYALPLAALSLKQGFGRLIRHSSHRGAVVILDTRMVKRQYGKVFFDVLPGRNVAIVSAREISPVVSSWLYHSG